jgi:prevent-host-death family protein
MRSWPLHEARSRIADVFEAATSGEPQRITRRGKRAVVVVSEEDWNRLAGGASDFGAFLATCPLADADLPPRRPARILQSGAFDD